MPGQGSGLGAPCRARSSRRRGGYAVAQVVGVHGVGQQHQGPLQLQRSWEPCLVDGLTLAGGTTGGVTFQSAFYGDLFRPPGHPLGGHEPIHDAADVEPGFEAELLVRWWEEAARVDSAVISPDSTVLIGVPTVVQRALDALSNSKFFAGLAERALISDLKQVRRYFAERELRRAAVRRVAAAVARDTRVIVGHSLGSVVAWEALCAHPEWSIDTFVTLGSPLGIRRLIFDQLDPPPRAERSGGPLMGAWPVPARRWVNIADEGDVVALVKDLRPRFGRRVEGFLVDNGAHVHDARPYLCAVETGRAIADSLAR